MSGRSQIGIVLLGLGVVGSGVARSISEKSDSYVQRIGVPIVLKKVLVRDAAKERDVSLDPSLLTTDPEEALSVDCDIVVEVMGGEQPAFDLMRRSLEAGRYVVTASKEVMAKHGPELLARGDAKHNTDILYEASVGGGIPIVSPLKRDLSANDITSLRAIINGTTNYILTRMSREGMDFGRRAQAGAGAWLRRGGPDERHRRHTTPSTSWRSWRAWRFTRGSRPTTSTAKGLRG